MGTRAEIGATIKQLREERGWSQGQLAKKVSLSQATISALERGVRTLSPRDAQAIAKTLKIGISEFMEGTTVQINEERGHDDGSPAEGEGTVQTTNQGRAVQPTSETRERPSIEPPAPSAPLADAMPPRSLHDGSPLPGGQGHGTHAIGFPGDDRARTEDSSKPQGEKSPQDVVQNNRKEKGKLPEIPKFHDLNKRVPSKRSSKKSGKKFSKQLHFKIPAGLLKEVDKVLISWIIRNQSYSRFRSPVLREEIIPAGCEELRRRLRQGIPIEKQPKGQRNLHLSISKRQRQEIEQVLLSWVINKEDLPLKTAVYRHIVVLGCEAILASRKMKEAS